MADRDWKATQSAAWREHMKNTRDELDKAETRAKRAGDATALQRVQEDRAGTERLEQRMTEEWGYDPKEPQ